MKKTILWTLLSVLITGQLSAQQTQSFHEYWFGKTTQKKVLKSTKSSPTPLSIKGLFAVPNSSGIITLDLNQPTNPESFTLASNNVWKGTYSNEIPYIEFNNSTFFFTHNIDGDAFGDETQWGSWDGFTYSKNADKTNYGAPGASGDWVAHQFGCMAGGGIKTDAFGNVLKDENNVILADPQVPYMVAFWGYFKKEWDMSENQTTQIALNDVYQAVGIYINNHPWPYYGNIGGDGFASALDQDGDFSKLIIHGLDGDYEDNGKAVEYYLAKNERGVLKQSPNWEWVDLSTLGRIGGVYFTMESSSSDPQFGMNTAAYFCMDKLQVKQVRDVTIAMNTISKNIVLKNKETQEEISVGSLLAGNKYSFKATPGKYTLYAYDGTTLNGTIELTITDEATQQFQFYTVTTYATNSGWTLNTDYTIDIKNVSSNKGVLRNTTLGSSTTANRSTFLAYSGDSYYVQFVPSESRAAEGYLIFEGSGTVTANAAKSGVIPMGYSYTITVPEDATAFVGKKGGHFQRFTEIVADNVTNLEGNTVYTYKLPGNQQLNYRISQPGKVTYATIFTKAASSESITITNDMLEGDPKALDYNLSSNNNMNVADIFLNINDKGHLKLFSGDIFQLVNIRAWQTVNSITGNYFIEPDFHYTVVNENGDTDHSVVTVDEQGLIKAIGNGNAIVLVTYDAINVASASGGPFFGAIWPENTGVFVVSVGASESGITSNMIINEALNASSNKEAGSKVDAELDVFYYLADSGRYDYTFTPSKLTSVTLAQPIVGENMTTYNGFSSENVTDNGDGSYTVHLTHGRNIIKMTSITGTAYQIITAKPVTYTITNASRSGEKLQPGDKASVRFNTLYHPNSKLSGVYNMIATLQYTANGATVASSGNQYAFANTAAAQTVSATIPTGWNVGNDFTFTGGVLKSSGFGDPFGKHREITLEIGRNPNFTAVSCLGYFGALPNISIRLQEAPSIPTNLTGVPSETSIAIKWKASVDNVAVKEYNVYVNGVLVETVTETYYTTTSLTAYTLYHIEVEAIDNDGNKSEKASLIISTIDVTAPSIPTELAGVQTETTIALSWTASTDNIMVTGYNVYVDGALVETVTGTTYTVNSLTASTNYAIEVEAFDAAGNKSTKASKTVFTLSVLNEILAESVSLNIENITLAKDSTYQLIATILPENATYQNVTWENSNPSIATVVNGLVTALAKGETTITVTTLDGEHIATCTITVSGNVGINTPEKNTVKIYPTITTGKITIVQEKTVEKVQIYTISGQLLQTFAMQSLESTIDINSYKSDVYMIRIGNQMVKVIKQ